MASSVNLDLRLLNFPIPAGWDTGQLPNPHDELQSFLQKAGLWGEQFRYGCAPSTIRAESQLMATGFAEPESGHEKLILYTTGDSRDFYCDGGFFEGTRMIAVYDALKLAQVGPRSYSLPEASALVAIVRPLLPV